MTSKDIAAQYEGTFSETRYPDELPVVMFEPDEGVADRARQMAAEAFYEPDYGRAPLPAPPLRIRILDWLGNLPYRFGRWVDGSAAAQKLCLAVGFVIAAALASVLVVPK